MEDSAHGARGWHAKTRAKDKRRNITDSAMQNVDREHSASFGDLFRKPWHDRSADLLGSEHGPSCIGVGCGKDLCGKFCS